MDRAGEIAILKSLLHYSETKSTALADRPWQNPVSAYTCPDRHRREEQVLIRARPLVWGLSCDWPRPGSYRTDDYTGVPVLTVRGRDGRLRAFINTCRHRGAKVASGEGSARSFTCPYHAWSYRDDGSLRAVPEAACFPGIVESRPGLTALPLAEKHGMVWVLPTSAADGSPDLDIDAFLGGLTNDLEFWKLSEYHLHARPDRAVMETSLYISKPAETEDEKRHWDANLALAIKVITTEDFPAGRSMQIGFSSGAQSHVIYDRNELALTHYHRSIQRALELMDID